MTIKRAATSIAVSVAGAVIAAYTVKHFKKKGWL